MKIERTLNAYRNIVVKVTTDEDIDDMEWAVVTEDHGDEYLIVKTKDKKLYKYGCFANLKHAEYTLNTLVRKPEMYKKLDANTSNKVYWLIQNELHDRNSNRISDPIRKCYSKDFAQTKFDRFVENLNEIYETATEAYDLNSYKRDALEFLEINGIKTEKNIEKVNSAHWDSRVDGIDGVAGKDDISKSSSVYFESLRDVYIARKEDLEIVKDYDTDEWGYGGYYLNIEPDPKLHANKHLYALVFGEESIVYIDDDDDGHYAYENNLWQDWMNDEEVKLSDSVTVLFNKTFVNEKTKEALYLVIDNSETEKPVAGYFSADQVLHMLGKG